MVYWGGDLGIGVGVGYGGVVGYVGVKTVGYVGVKRVGYVGGIYNIQRNNNSMNYLATCLS